MGVAGNIAVWSKADFGGPRFKSETTDCTKQYKLESAGYKIGLGWGTVH